MYWKKGIISHNIAYISDSLLYKKEGVELLWIHRGNYILMHFTAVSINWKYTCTKGIFVRVFTSNIYALLNETNDMSQIYPREKH